jgi:hypothetical protein
MPLEAPTRDISVLCDAGEPSHVPSAATIVSTLSLKYGTGFEHRSSCGTWPMIVRFIRWAQRHNRP